MTDRNQILRTMRTLAIGSSLRLEKEWTVRAPLVTGPELLPEATVTFVVTRSSYAKFTITLEGDLPEDMTLELADLFARHGVAKK